MKHPICSVCHWKQSRAEPKLVNPRTVVTAVCCFCLRTTRSGLYVEAAVEALPCVGHGHEVRP